MTRNIDSVRPHHVRMRESLNDVHLTLLGSFAHFHKPRSELNDLAEDHNSTGPSNMRAGMLCDRDI